MKSIAIWSEPPLPNESQNELHINYWELPSKGKKTTTGGFITFIDFGLKINKLKSEGSINFLFPFIFDKKAIIPLNSACCDVKVACAIFNENYSISNSAIEKFHKFQLDKNNNFYFYELSESNFSVKTAERDKSVTKMQIKFPKNMPTDASSIYVRFRLLTNRLQGLSSFEPLTNAPFQKIISKVETIDFRINDLRDIGIELNEETLASRSFYKFNKLHFFFMCASQRELTLSNRDWVNCRYLENCIWDTYLEGIEHNARHILAYHWKCKPDTNEQSFTLLIKSLVEFTDRKLLVGYGILSVFVGIIIGCASNYTYECIKNVCSKSKGPISNVLSSEKPLSEFSSKDNASNCLQNLKTNLPSSKH